MCNRDQSDFNKVLSDLKDRFGRQVFPITRPLNEGENFSKISDLLQKKVLEFSKNEQGYVTAKADVKNVGLYFPVALWNHKRFWLNNSTTNHKFSVGFFFPNLSIKLTLILIVKSLSLVNER